MTNNDKSIKLFKFLTVKKIVKMTTVIWWLLGVIFWTYHFLLLTINIRTDGMLPYPYICKEEKWVKILQKGILAVRNNTINLGKERQNLDI